MAVSSWLYGLAGVAAGAAILSNLPSRFLFPVEKATLKYLASTQLQTLGSSENKLFQEAQGLSSLKPQLSSLGFELYAVVHETKGVDEFRPFFDGEIFLDKERRFYGPKERWMFWSALLRAGFWSNTIRAMRKGVPGNFKGEGRLLGGVFVIGFGDQGVLLEHREGEFGDHANLTDIIDALKKSPKPKLA